MKRSEAVGLHASCEGNLRHIPRSGPRGRSVQRPDERLERRSATGVGGVHQRRDTRVVASVSGRRVGCEQRPNPICIALVDQLEDRVMILRSTCGSRLVRLTKYVIDRPMSTQSARPPTGCTRRRSTFCVACVRQTWKAMGISACPRVGTLRTRLRRRAIADRACCRRAGDERDDEQARGGDGGGGARAPVSGRRTMLGRSGSSRRPRGGAFSSAAGRRGSTCSSGS